MSTNSSPLSLEMVAQLQAILKQIALWSKNGTHGFRTISSARIPNGSKNIPSMRRNTDRMQLPLGWPLHAHG